MPLSMVKNIFVRESANCSLAEDWWGHLRKGDKSSIKSIDGRKRDLVAKQKQYFQQGRSDHGNENHQGKRHCRMDTG